jgi:hypothetical protein
VGTNRRIVYDNVTTQNINSSSKIVPGKGRQEEKRNRGRKENREEYEIRNCK